MVLGTRAVSDPRWLDDVINRYGHDKVVVSVDSVGGIVAIDGWETRTSLSVGALGSRLHSQGVERIVFTDILADHEDSGSAPDYMAIERMAVESKLRLIVSGGVRRIEHLEELYQRLGDQLEGVIVARGIADETFDLKKAIELYQNSDEATEEE